jgi:hypothetical protein
MPYLPAVMLEMLGGSGEKIKQVGPSFRDDEERPPTKNTL